MTATRSRRTRWSLLSLILCLMFLSASVGYCAAESKVQAAPRKVVAVIPADLPPTYFLDQSGKPAGFAIDVTNELATRTGLTVEYITTKGWDEAIQMVLDNKADLIPSLTINEQRKTLLAFTETVDFLLINLVVASGNQTVQGITPGLTIGVLKGSAPHNFLAKNQTIKLAIFNDLQTMLFELLAGHVDGIVSLTSNIMTLAADAGIEDKVKVVGKPVLEAKRAIALRKSNTELLNRLNKVINAFVDSPEYSRLYVKWYGKPKPYWTPARVGWSIGGISAALITIFIVWRFREKELTNQQLEQTVALLRASEDRFRNYVVNSPHAIFICAENGRYVDVNPAACGMTGYDEKELLAMSIQDLLPQESLAWAAVHFQEVLSSGRTSGEAAFRRKNGEIGYWSLAGVRLSPTRIMGFVTEITGRKLMEEALLNERQRLEGIIRGTNVGTWEWNVQTGGAVFNDRWAEIIGYTLAELSPVSIDTWMKFAHPDDLEASDELLNKHFRGELDYYEFESRMKHKDGHWVWVLDRGKVATWAADKKPLLMLGTHQDITERKQSEHERKRKTAQLEDLTKNLEQRVTDEMAIRRKNEDILVQQSKLATMGEMLGAISHQWRQPLNALGVIVQNIGQAYEYGELDKGYIEKAVKKSMDQIRHMSKTIDDFRNFFKPDKEASLFDTMEAVGDVLSLLSAQLKANGIEFRMTCHTHGKTFDKVSDIVSCREKTVKGFRNEFEHTILNIINNARDAIAERKKQDTNFVQGMITLDFYRENGNAIIKISDNGVGINPKAMDRIFEPYFTTKDPAQGTGLGLYMSKVIMTHMGGNLSAGTREQGAEFIIELPGEK